MGTLESCTWYVMGPVVIAVGAAWLRGGLEVLGHTRQMHPNTTRLAALTLKQERPMTMKQGHPSTSQTFRKLQENGKQAGDLNF